MWILGQLWKIFQFENVMHCWTSVSVISLSNYVTVYCTYINVNVICIFKVKKTNIYFSRETSQVLNYYFAKKDNIFSRNCNKHYDVCMRWFTYCTFDPQDVIIDLPSPLKLISPLWLSGDKGTVYLRVKIWY